MGGEFDVIARSLLGRIQPVTTELGGPGDDAAIVTSGDGRVVVSSDMLVEGRHFRMDWSSPRDIGRKAVAQNAADVVSMGARPTAFTVSLGGCPSSTPVDVVDAISAGIWDAATDLGAGVVGGDLVQSPVIVVSVTVLGDLGGRAAVLRSGAKIGDKIAVAGWFGCSAAGWHYCSTKPCSSTSPQAFQICLPLIVFRIRRINRHGTPQNQHIP